MLEERNGADLITDLNSRRYINSGIIIEGLSNIKLRISKKD